LRGVNGGWIRLYDVVTQASVQEGNCMVGVLSRQHSEPLDERKH
jgi:hypothetical protein